MRPTEKTGERPRGGNPCVMVGGSDSRRCVSREAGPVSHGIQSLLFAALGRCLQVESRAVITTEPLCSLACHVGSRRSLRGVPRKRIANGANEANWLKLGEWMWLDRPGKARERSQFLASGWMLRPIPWRKRTNEANFQPVVGWISRFRKSSKTKRTFNPWLDGRRLAVNRANEANFKPWLDVVIDHRDRPGGVVARTRQDGSRRRGSGRPATDGRQSATGSGWTAERRWAAATLRVAG